MDTHLLDRIIDVLGDDLWTGTFRLTPKRVAATNFAAYEGPQTATQFTAHDLLEIARLQTEMPKEFCQALVKHFGDRVEGEFHDTPLTAAMFFYVARIPRRASQPVLTRNQKALAKMLLGVE